MADDQHVFAALLQQAADIDRLSGISHDRELMPALSAIRRHLDVALVILGRRVEMPPKLPRQRVRECMCPGDRP